MALEEIDEDAQAQADKGSAGGNRRAGPRPGRVWGADDLGGGGGGGSDTGTGATGGETDCSAFEEYGTFDGETVTIFSSIREVEADQLQDTFEAFTECTGITVEHNGSGEFEQQDIHQRAEGLGMVAVLRR